MVFLTGYKGREAEIIDLFTATFTASEGEEEGTLIGELVRKLLASTAQEDLFVFTAKQDSAIIGGIAFSRLTYEQDQRTVFVLAPVAVAPDHPETGKTISWSEMRAYLLERVSDKKTPRPRPKKLAR